MLLFIYLIYFTLLAYSAKIYLEVKNMSKTIEMLKSYAPTCEQEIGDKNFFIECEEKEQILTRENTLCHLTSFCIYNK